VRATKGLYLSAREEGFSSLLDWCSGWATTQQHGHFGLTYAGVNKRPGKVLPVYVGINQCGLCHLSDVRGVSTDIQRGG
jgi:hypothetical protein